MNAYEVAKLAFVFAEQARILGMQAENQQRAHLGLSMAYAEDSFLIAAQKLEELAIATLNGQ